MKTTKTLLAALAIALVFGACSKEEANKQNLMATAEPDPSSLVLGFKQKMENHKNGIYLKSDEKIQIDSAIWYIDATLNFTYANGNHPFARLHWDTLFIEMDILNSYEAMYQQVFDGYDASLYGVSDKYHDIPEENKQFMMAMVEDMGPLPGNKRNLRIITVTGTGTLVHSGDFGQGEAYSWDRNATLDCKEIPDPASGAPIIFEALLKDRYGTHPNPNCRWVYYGTPETVTYWFYDYPSGLTYPPNYMDYKVFFASPSLGPITDETTCLEYNQHGLGLHEMQYYYDNLKDFVDAYHNSTQNTGNRWFVAAYIESDEIITPNQEIIQHIPQITYRKRMLECSMTFPIPER